MSIEISQGMNLQGIAAGGVGAAGAIGVGDVLVNGKKHSTTRNVVECVAAAAAVAGAGTVLYMQHAEGDKIEKANPGTEAPHAYGLFARR